MALREDAGTEVFVLAAVLAAVWLVSAVCLSGAAWACRGQGAGISGWCRPWAGRGAGMGGRRPAGTGAVPWATAWLCAFALLAVSAGLARAGQARQRLDRELAWGLGGDMRAMSGRVVRVEERESGLVVLLDRARPSTAGPGRAGGDGVASVRLLAYLDEAPPLFPGNTIRLRGEVAACSPARNPGEFDSRLYYRSQNISYRMFAEDVEVMDGSYWPYAAAIQRLRGRLQAVLDRIADGEDRGILSAAILGNRSGLEPQVRDLYQKHGMAHLLAISGLHISLIGMCVYRVMRRMGMGLWAAGIAAGVLVASYGGLTGSNPSVVRAVAMMLCGFGARGLGRTYDLLTAAALAAWGLLWDMPYLLTQAGFQLSFGAVLALGALEPLLRRLLDIRRGWQAALLGGAAIQCVTYPIILYHYFSFPIYSILLNLIVIPLMAFVLASGLLGIGLGLFSAASGRMALGAAHYILWFYGWLCGVFGRLPAWNLVLGRPGFGRIALYGGMALAALAAGGLWKRRRGRPLPWALLPAFLAACFFCLYPLPRRGLEVAFLDVGQGDGIVLASKGLSVLVDGGSSSEKKLGEYRLEPFLESRGIARLDYAIVSHGDSDHISGLVYLLEEGDIRIGTLVLPALGKGEEPQARLARLAAKRGGRVAYMEAGNRIRAGELSITCLYPGPGDPAKDRNEQSLLLKVDYGEFHMLLTGDMTRGGEERVLAGASGKKSLADVQVLKAAHHGSDTSSGEGWIGAMGNLRWAVLSYGEGNSYGHPNPGVVERLLGHRARLWETARQGAILLKTDGHRIRWETCLP